MVKDLPVHLNVWVATRLRLGILEKGNISGPYMVINLKSLVMPYEAGYALLTSYLCIKLVSCTSLHAGHEVVL